MKSLDIPIVIAPTLTLPRQRGRGIPGFSDGDKLMEDKREEGAYTKLWGSKERGLR
jgi:hypothetical protein